MEAEKHKRENPLINIAMNVVIPTLILTKLSKPEYLGQNMGFVVAIAFPVAYGIYDLIFRKKYNLFSIIGFISVLLTGGIGLLKLDGGWIVVKETSIPLLMGIVVIVMERFNKSFIKIIFKEVIDLEKIEQAYNEGKITWQKPLSCHLYPIRIKAQKDFDAINYDKWEICSDACVLGKELHVPVYKFLKTPLIRKYGEEWYKDLEEIAALVEKEL